jgi:ABC-type transport system involved in multi-copper enzyme maturation permease subunit
MLHYHSGLSAKASWLGVVVGAIGKAGVNLVAWNAFEATRHIMHVISATMMELAIITAFAVLYSSFSTPALSMAFTVMTFIAGRLNEDLIAFAENVARKADKTGQALPMSYHLAEWASLVTPNLGVFHRTVEQALYENRVTLWWESVLYAILYPIGILFLAMLIFNRRNFK